ncbi:MAG: DUF3552 domain-containing protein, partial [Alloprevotella sp.]|nr:DUF3552 domain-containing protein [Alloprevotella sp.]
MITAISSVAALLIGAVVGYALFRYVLTGIYRRKIAEAKREAEVIKEKKLLEVKETFINRKAEFDKEAQQRKDKMQQAENRLKQREQSQNQRQDDLNKRTRELDKRVSELDRRNGELDTREQDLEKTHQALQLREGEIEKMRQQELQKLEELSGLSAEEAKTRLEETMKAEARTAAQIYKNEIMDEARISANKEAKKIVIKTIQRVATETAVENSVTVFHIDNDEVKGRIIGREGRNIRTLEAAAGVEIVVDDTPEAIVISAFDPVRREIARLALHQLISDGRIHPARIEEVVSKVKKQVEEEIIETGKRTAIDLGIHGLHPELIRIIGKMKYRSSYGQNLLQHARETA